MITEKSSSRFYSYKPKLTDIYRLTPLVLQLTMVTNVSDKVRMCECNTTQRGYVTPHHAYQNTNQCDRESDCQKPLYLSNFKTVIIDC